MELIRLLRGALLGFVARLAEAPIFSARAIARLVFESGFRSFRKTKNACKQGRATPSAIFTTLETGCIEYAKPTNKTLLHKASLPLLTQGGEPSAASKYR